jgi:ribosomal RNA-processing protein 12
MHIEVFSTLLVFLSSANREIVKSTLGYIKLAVHTLRAELLRPQLPQLVPALLGWSHDHKNHFKAKVRHIFERMIRRFGWEDVYRCAGEDEARKVLVNIKKRKERAKRKRAAAVDSEEEVERTTGNATTGDAFEDVLYGSESEVEDSDEEGEVSTQTRAGKRKGPQAGPRLRVDEDEPMDLLSGAASRITSKILLLVPPHAFLSAYTGGKAGNRRKPGQDAAQYKTEEDTGKMIIDDGDSDDETGATNPQRTEDVAGTAYRESLTSVDGFTRGLNGRVKFNKDTKKRRRDAEDIDMADPDELIQNASGKKPRSKMEQKLGHEFKAKVRSRFPSRVSCLTKADRPPESWWRRQERRS